MNTIPSQEGLGPGSTPAARFFSLRMKFVVFFSLILIVTCSSLSWYFIESRHAAMTDSLQELGTILLTNTVHNDHFRIGGIVLEDHETLDQFMQSLMAIDHVTYVIITASDGRVLDQHSKLTRTPPDDTSPRTGQQIYPDNHISEPLLQSPLTAPLMHKLVLSAEQRLVPQDTPDWFFSLLSWQDTVYDLALPVLRKSSAATVLPQHAAELSEPPAPDLPQNPSPVIGVVQIGISDTQAKQALLMIIRNVSILTVFIIAAGILGAHLLISRITTPLQRLAAAARQLATGHSVPALPVPSTLDEVGQLTQLFNVMAQSLYDRNRAITMNIDTITRQIRQLTTVHQASTAIASAGTLRMDQLLGNVLNLLATNLGFSRMAVVLHHAGENHASVAQIIGVPPEIAEAASRLDIPVDNNDGITAELLMHGKPLLIHDIDAIAHRLYQPALELLRRSGFWSFVAVPLKSHAKNIGYIMANRNTQLCNEDDLHILLTIAGHVAAAIDNARAYTDLTELTQHLEERIAQRTEELSRANIQLQDHDRRRSMFLSVVSHELRTPMTAIRSFADNMLDGITGPLNELQRTYLTRIQHNVARLGRIIVQLLDWSRLDTKNVELRFEPVCIHNIAMIAADSLQTIASDKHVSITVAPLGSLPLVIGDRDKLEQILWNLIGNAIKFTPPGGRVTVEFRGSPPGFVETCVADTGCGIDPSHMPNMFEEFSRIPSAMPASQGAQLGLCITKTLVTLHHGEIWADSQPGVGSHLHFTLPAVETPDHPDRTI